MVTITTILESYMSSTPKATTMSVAILPSTPAPCIHAPILPIMIPSPAKRPKLSLDTTTTPSTSILAGKHSTSLRLETLSATSPTVRNTFGNAYENQKPTLSKLTTTNINPSKRRYAVTPQHTREEDEHSPASATTTCSPVNAPSRSLPYNVSLHISSILRNGPMQHARNQRKSLAHLKQSFKIAKKVVFRAPLTEVVTTTKYTLSHLDIEPPTPIISTKEQSEVEVSQGGEEGDQQVLLQPSTYVAQSKEALQEPEPDSCPATPVAGRRKKDRQWQWTLGPVEPISGKTIDPNMVLVESPNMLAIDAQ